MLYFYTTFALHITHNKKEILSISNVIFKVCNILKNKALFHLAVKVIAMIHSPEQPLLS